MLVIVIPTRNRRALLERALGSMLSQTYPAWRAVVINDASTDDTQKYLATLHDPRITTVNFEHNRGVNAARNAGFNTLVEDEWALPLDDDDMFLPGAFETIARAVEQAPLKIQVLCFNTVIRTTGKEFPGGYNFAEGEEYYEPSYNALMTGEGLRMYEGSENRALFKWTLFPKYLFEEGINGLEGEWWLKAGRDNVGIRYLPGQIILIDWAHQGEHLSDTAARRNPASFARAHRRMFGDHAAFLAAHPRLAAQRALHAFKLSLRAFDPALACYFAFKYLQASARKLYVRSARPV